MPNTFEWIIIIIGIVCLIYTLYGAIDYFLFYRYAKKKGWFKK